MIIASTAEGWGVDYVMMPILLGFIGTSPPSSVFLHGHPEERRRPRRALATPRSSVLAVLARWLRRHQPAAHRCEMGIMHSVVLGSIVGILIGLVSNTTRASSP